MALYDNLFEPLKIGALEIPNRIVRSAHSVALGGEELIAYHEARARGGVGMSVLQATSVAAAEPSHIPAFSDDVLPFYESISKRLHKHGMKVLLQLYHRGASGRVETNLQTLLSVGEVPNPLFNITPMQITRTRIHELIAEFASAARRCRDGGLDGIELHASSGYLLHEFLSPALNQRTDEYGGSFENRMRLLDEIINAVRAEVGPDFALGVRIPNDDFVPGGLDPEENAKIAAALDGRVDYIGLHMSSYWRFHRFMAPTDDPLGTEMPANNKVTVGLKTPTMVTGRIMTLDHASAIVRDGQGDMVSMVRALIADPELVNKARRREEHRIKPCISTNIGCVGQYMSKGVMTCVVNRAAARELHVDDEGRTATKPKKILVVGGGPAGLEAARLAALRGHDVELHEAGARLGGQLLLAAKAPHRADIGQIVDWQISELEILGVDVQLNSLVDEAMIEASEADEIILATGTTPRTDFQIMLPADDIPGHDLPHVYTSWDVLGAGRPVTKGKRAVVFDDTGTFEAISVADVLLDSGFQVTMVSRFEKIGETLPYTPVTVGAARERLMSKDFDFIGGHHILEITKGQVDFGVLFTKRVRSVEADTVVIVGFNQPNRYLVETLEAQGRRIHLVGNVSGRSDLMSALHSSAECMDAL
ncbi:FAD-dependent oxidoreductase [Phaeovulum sp. NW3]|uniref:oxidoreductase n=1 Tax=Phaeovulum sp. NW3 TaxID=2934933 RepID=UPI0020228254|nr:FAD-dependent oxidoreductase [Phaeovulum sp. NW3]MCL7466843.1 FAD-dependent oxidoreductase [Phaeovulum sp. NW3]